MDIILIPGFWLDASSWEEVVPTLEQAGHRTHALTLPGMESRDVERSEIILRDHIDAVVAAIDSVGSAASKVVLVGHSGGGATAHGAVDTRPERVARVVYVDSGPLGGAMRSTISSRSAPAKCRRRIGPSSTKGTSSWSFFDEGDLVGLDDQLLAAFRERAIPSPARVARDAQELSDERRYAVPVTVIACEVSSETIQEWVTQGHPYVAELAKIRDVEYVDLPTGHWRQFTRADKLGQVILASVGSA